MRTAARTAVLLDRHPLWLDAVEAVLDRMGVGVVGKATAPEAALELVTELRPDVLVAEPQSKVGRISGVGCLAAARQAVPTLKMIALSNSAEPTDIDAAFAAGAVAYVLKTAHPDDVAAAIRQAFDHSIFLAVPYAPPTQDVPGVAAAAPTARGAAGADLSSLTKREYEILQLVAEGHSNGELARMLWVTEQTIKFHLSNIYRKLNVSNRTEASRWVQPANLLSTAREPASASIA
ncbi:MAG: response regulator transcription factor [Actinobacteria bacterium]|nr:response regulator transcription factor [Actinomycetota bacterium]